MTKPPEGPACILHQVHHPSVARNVEWQVAPGETVVVCPTGAVNLDVCRDYMLGLGPAPSVKIGRSTWDVAQRAVDAHEHETPGT